MGEAASVRCCAEGGGSEACGAIEGVTVRSVCVGLLVVIFVNFWILYSLYLIQASWLQVTHFPMGLFVPFMLLALLINPILKAARGTDSRTYPWGEQEPTGAYAVMDEGGYCGRSSWLNPPSGPVQSICQTLPVGSRPRGASPYGVQDMAGNVWEWCGDWYNETYYSKSLKKNPQGPSTGDFRVVRGGRGTTFRVTSRRRPVSDFIRTIETSTSGFAVFKR